MKAAWRWSWLPGGCPATPGRPGWRHLGRTGQDRGPPEPPEALRGRDKLRGASAAVQPRAMAAGAQEIASGPAPAGGQGAAAATEPSPRVATGLETEAAAGPVAAPPGGCGARAGGRGRLGAAWARRLCPAGATPGGVPVPAPRQRAGTRQPRGRRERERSSGRAPGPGAGPGPGPCAQPRGDGGLSKSPSAEVRGALGALQQALKHRQRGFRGQGSQGHLERGPGARFVCVLQAFSRSFIVYIVWFE